ncbi:hypothetical protein BGI30_05875 [Snodgrassella alvi]|nr:hypothetical protein BGI30_05875 [Snodgrassella alvi]PIT45098.1 hypothetical protein BHC51_09005 [Snodgrassella alvi]PIT57842.1 hypothetical protein BHC59_02915 [Snodgrassella alvi]
MDGLFVVLLPEYAFGDNCLVFYAFFLVLNGFLLIGTFMCSLKIFFVVFVCIYCVFMFIKFLKIYINY